MKNEILCTLAIAAVAFILMNIFFSAPIIENAKEWGLLMVLTLCFMFLFPSSKDHSEDKRA